MKVIVDNTLRIQNPSREVLDYCKRELEIDNPQYFQNQRLGFFGLENTSKVTLV